MGFVDSTAETENAGAGDPARIDGPGSPSWLRKAGPSAKTSNARWLRSQISQTSKFSWPCFIVTEVLSVMDVDLAGIQNASA